ncbi:hypothetical protein BGZ70_009529 [Mortierella alpina]|uniref:TAFII28-like protein domain-containing protein n=1 Tax=Mortierella alpina TaxID=64518 RepID=A0A9P6J4B5_MORAP|nr:hypothetical protein BGZ70_009529 [Mortierella alpina]
MGGTSVADMKTVKHQDSAAATIKDNDSDNDHDHSEDRAESMDLEYEQDFQLKSNDKENVRALVESLSDEQYERFVAYRRATLNRFTVKALLNTLLDQEVSQGLTVLAAGCGKLFVGEMVERGDDPAEKSSGAA